jgi:hypothetical protein
MKTQISNFHTKFNNFNNKKVTLNSTTFALCVPKQQNEKTCAKHAHHLIESKSHENLSLTV